MTTTMSPLDVLLNTVTYDHRKRVKDDVKALTDRTQTGALLPKIGTYGKISPNSSLNISLIGRICL